MQPVDPTPLVEPFAQRLLAADLPGLDPQRRGEAVAFVLRRIRRLPSFTLLGVTVLAVAFRVLLALPGGWTCARVAVRLPLPFVPEYPRLIRSLAVAYVWETWPDTRADGAAPSRVAA